MAEDRRSWIANEAPLEYYRCVRYGNVHVTVILLPADEFSFQRRQERNQEMLVFFKDKN